MRKFVTSIALLISIALLCACSATTTTRIYDGPELPPSEIAIVRGDRYLDVRKVDGKEGSFSVQVFRGEWTSKGFELHLLPGPHAIEVGYGGDYLRSVAPIAIRFVAQSGKIYRVKYEILKSDRKWRAWLEEEAGT